jgi:hypothetical protein
MKWQSAQRWKRPALLAAIAPLLIAGCTRDSAEGLTGVSHLATGSLLAAVVCTPDIHTCTPFSGVMRVTSVNVSASTITGVIDVEFPPQPITVTPKTVWLQADLTVSQHTLKSQSRILAFKY